ncbi:hypothetical protein [Streptomyces sp. CC208A]|uniref:hypothetical protein n=1 Tax=Streptomyces sp. CC208A TaxID=3044573 RepID=UPI0024A8DE45|nr:hypothetical protein [Streptomyces sp. CC208A]
MGESVSVRCPECRRSHPYAAPVFPCACGSPVAAPVIPDAPAEPVRHRTWQDEWVTVRCGACGREDEWPHPELGCSCGAVLRIPVAPVTAETPVPPVTAETEAGAGVSLPGPETTPEEGYGSEGYGPRLSEPDDSAGTGPAPDPAAFLPARDPEAEENGEGPAAPVSDWFGAPPRSFAERYPAHLPFPPAAPRPAPARGAFRPVTIRTARDAVAAAAAYLDWLGFREIVQPEDRHSAAVDLRGPGLVAQVDPTTRPTGLRAVECLWLNGLSASAVSVFFSLAGYTPEARSRAVEIRLPLFVLDLTGTPQPVNDAADELTSGGAI